MKVEETPAGYLVLAERPETGETAGGSFADIAEAIARATELIRASYIVEIRSITSRT